MTGEVVNSDGPAQKGGPKMHWGMLVCLALAGIFAWYVVQLVSNRCKLTFGPVPATETQLAQFRGGLEEFHHRCGIYPTTAQGLAALSQWPNGLDCPRFEAQILPGPSPGKSWEDAWKVPYKYESDGNHYRIEASHGLVIEGP